MLISYKYKFIFLHNRKVAGTSIKNSLSNYGLISPTTYASINRLSEKFKFSRYLNYKISQKCGFIPNYRFHGTALELKNQISENIWDSFFKFTFVRNPWDLQVSLYFYMLKRKDHFQHDTIKQMKSFDEYIEWVVNKKVFLQKEYVFDNNNHMIIDFVGKYENLSEDFDKIIKYLGLNTSLPHINKSNHNVYRKYYNTHTKNLIGDAFKKDIELFTYEF